MYIYTVGHIWGVGASSYEIYPIDKISKLNFTIYIYHELIRLIINM